MRTKYLLLFTVVSLCLFSCIKMFVPDVNSDEELLVVDGLLTDAPGPYTVTLSKSNSVRQLSKFKPYPDCKVKIEDDFGTTVELTEKAPGVYVTDSAVFKTNTGRTYTLHILTPDGNEYESAKEMLLPPVGIQSVYGELQHKNDPKLFYGRDGYQFYIDLEPQTNNNDFLMWRLQSTYKFTTDLELYAYYTDGVRHLVDDGDSLRTCYRTVDILDLFTFSSKALNPDGRKKIPLNYEDNYTKALSIRYSLKVTQFTISETAFNYWNIVKKMRDMQGDLYSQQPFQVNNNLKNKTHPEKIALGYFTVGGVSEKRIFVNRPAIEDHFDVCTLTGEPVKHLDDKLKLRPDLWPFFLVDPVKYHGDFWVDQECIDCRKLGVLEKPSFWID